MLTFWDCFKQLETYSVRKVANLAKLMAHLVGTSADKRGSCLTIGVLKRIEFSPSDMPEMVIVFLSIFLTALFESCDVQTTEQIFSHDVNSTTGSSSKAKRKQQDVDPEDDDDSDDGEVQSTKKEDLSDLRESLSIFLLQYVKTSPKNVEGSQFHSNLLAALSSCEK